MAELDAARDTATPGIRCAPYRAPGAAPASPAVTSAPPAPVLPPRAVHLVTPRAVTAPIGDRSGPDGM